MGKPPPRVCEDMPSDEQVADLPLDSWPDVEARVGVVPPGHEGIWHARWTMPVTIAYGLRQLPRQHMPKSQGRGRDGRWLIHVLGARDELEGELARRAGSRFIERSC